MSATVLAFARRGGKTALQWHLLRQESARVGLPIECVQCERPHEKPPLLGRCACGSYAFGVGRRPDGGQLALGLDYHGGEV
jgi:hypothetical protein